MLHITSSQSNPKKAHSRRQTNPRKQSWGVQKTFLKAKNYSRLGFSPHFAMMLRNKPQQVKISPEKTQGFHLNECSIVVVFKGIDEVGGKPEVFSFRGNIKLNSPFFSSAPSPFQTPQCTQCLFQTGNKPRGA